MRSVSLAADWKRWTARACVVTGAALVLAAAGAWLAFRHTPSWYDPPELTADDLPRVRATLPAAYQEFTDRLADGGTFEFRLSAEEVNEWIAARDSLWPDARGMLPVWLRNPVLVFSDDRIILASRYHRGRWSAVVSLHLSVSIKGADAVIRIERVAAGALPLPASSLLGAIDEHIARILERKRGLAESLAHVSDVRDHGILTAAAAGGVPVRNRLHWSNGDRWFRIVKLRARRGWLILTVEVL